MIFHVLSCLVKQGSQSDASSIPACGQRECYVALNPSQHLLMQPERPKTPEAFAATPLSLPQRPEHTVQTSKMHSQTHGSYHDCFSSNNVCFLSSGLVRGDNRQTRTTVRWRHRSLFIMFGSRVLALSAQITLRSLWLVNTGWTAIAGT